MKNFNLSDINELPSLPEVVRQVQDVILTGSGGAKELADIIGSDGAMAASLLKLANSSFYNYSGKKIVDLQTAIVRIGRSEVYKFITSKSIISLFRNSELIDLQLLWQRSLVSVSLVKEIAKVIGLQQAEITSLEMATLFSDLGMIIVANFIPEYLEELQKAWEMNGAYEKFYELEYRVEGNYYTSILASNLLEIWKLSDELFIPIKYKNNYNSAPLKYQLKTKLIYFADLLTSLTLTPLGISAKTRENIELLLSSIGIDSNIVEKLIILSITEAEEAITMLESWGIDNSSFKLKSISSASLLRPL